MCILKQYLFSPTILLFFVVSSLNSGIIGALNPNSKTANSPYVILDAGHGGTDAGSPTPEKAIECGIPSNIHEKDFTLDITLRVSEILSRNHVRVGLTRKSDVSVAHITRTNLINQEMPDFSVSIHTNSGPEAKGCGDGVEAFYSSIGPNYTKNSNVEKSRELAELLANRISQKFGLRLRRNNGADDANLHMVREPKVPSALIEMAFISNVKELKLIQERPGDFADAIASAILEQLGLPPDDGSDTNPDGPVLPDTPEITPGIQNKIELLFNQILEKIREQWSRFWDGQKDKINQWYQEQLDKFKNSLTNWWEETQRKLEKQAEQQLTDWINETCGAGIIPLIFIMTALIRQRKLLG